MKRNVLLVAVMVFVFGAMLSAAEPVVVKPFNGVNFDGWQVKPGRQNVWTVGRLASNSVADSATKFEVLPMRGGQGGQGAGAAGGAGPRGVMINDTGNDWRDARPGRGADIYTTEKFGDCTVKVEFLVLKGGNSGVYLMGEYEVQIADIFGRPANRPLGQGDMGAIYSAAPPSRNAASMPGTWQSFEIEFVAPKFDAEGNKTANAFFKKITLNGIVVQEDVEVKGPTGGGLTMKEAPTGPLMFQGDHGPIAFRNVEIIVNK